MTGVEPRNGRKTRNRGRHLGHIFEQRTYKIQGACFEVYKDKRCGFLEAVFHRAQVHNHLKSTGHKVRLLFNFGHYTKVEHERIIR